MHQLTKNYILNNESASRTELLVTLYILSFFILTVEFSQVL